MNQRADSWKENFLPIATNPLINQQGLAFESHHALQQG